MFAYYLWHFKHRNGAALAWTVLAGAMVICSPLAMSGSPPALPAGVKTFVNWATGPVVYSVGTTALLAFLFVFRRFFVQPMAGWGLLNAVLVLMGLSMADPNFAAIVTKPDNVPIVGLIYLLGFFTWLATSRAVENDDRMAQGLEPVEKLGNEKVLVWPDLVYTELICMIAITALLLVWGIALQAPLEEPASRVKTPNPSKAPWYFLGLQEMLVYYDPWMAGVVLPSLIIVGLMAIPYLDFNKQGNGYYTINQRKFSYLIFQFGFLELWVTLIILGTFFRGPNWNIFGPFEFWDPHKVLALNNVDLSQYFWTYGLNMGLPKAARRGIGREPVLYFQAGMAGDRAGAGLLRAVAPHDGDDGLSPLLRQNGLRPFHGAVESVFVHGGAAHQDGFALGVQPQIHRRHSRVLLEFLTTPAGTCAAGSGPCRSNRGWLAWHV